MYKYICPWCTIVFPSEQERIEHLWSAHGVEVREDVLEEDSANEKLAGTSNDNLETLGDGDAMTIKKKKISRKINILRGIIIVGNATL